MKLKIATKFRSELGQLVLILAQIPLDLFAKNISLDMLCYSI